ncbi:MAG TPA: SDR family oxidoreductase [Candidatus Acidoferrales bacterium]|nr:SDR family oxidoreductase [Candidatus Acidoferrales bacterium]
MDRLKGKVAIITGAASGIGRATAIKFAGEGAAVVVADLNTDGGEASVRDCKENGGRAIFQKTNVSAEAEIKALVARAVKEFGRLDIIYNNAGIGGAIGPLEQISVEDWDRSQAVLLRGVFLGIKHSVPEMRKIGGGSIISTASVAGIRGFAGLHAYCAAKAGVVNLTRSAALEFAKDKIRVNCICPGGINTPILHRNQPGMKEAMEKFMADGQPIPRAGHPEDIAGMALYLASDDAEFVTGQAMIVDGGLTVGSQYSRNAGGANAPVLAPGSFMGPSFEG